MTGAALGQSEQSKGSGSGQAKDKGGQEIGRGLHHSGPSVEISVVVDTTVRYWMTASRTVVGRTTTLVEVDTLGGGHVITLGWLQVMALQGGHSTSGQSSSGQLV